MVSLIRGLFGQALKTNDYLQFAILSRKSGNGSGIRPRMTVRDWKNASDGVIAPMIYLAVGGPVLGFAYKAVNTMDSMVGYKNEKNLYFGRFAAKLDDVVNFIPSRVAALLMIVASFLPGKRFSGTGAWKIWRRDSRKHASPNSAQTESDCAGSLGMAVCLSLLYFL